MKNKIGLILLVITAALLIAYSGKVTGSSFNDGVSSTGNVLRVKDMPLFGVANNFVVLAGSGITNVGTTTVTGDIGSFPTYSAPGGTITFSGSGADHGADAFTQEAKTDLNTAYIDAAGRTPVTLGTELGGTNPAPGVYTAGTFAITGTLTLTGNATDFWIFQTSTTLITADTSEIIMGGTAKAANVYWAVGSSATLGAYSIFKGNIMASASITLNTGANVEGRVLAQTAAVTLDGNTIVKPVP
jgi:hypothetical protein